MEKKIGNIFGFTGGNYAGNVYDKDYLSPTLNTMQGGCKQSMIVETKCVGGLGEKKSNNGTQYRIRKLTPKECWRLMDFSDDYFEKAEKVNSNTQLYKQAGNSIVVNVLASILGQLLKGKEDLYKEIS